VGRGSTDRTLFFDASAAPAATSRRPGTPAIYRCRADHAGIMTVALRFAAIFLKRSTEASVAAWSVLNVVTRCLRNFPESARDRR